MPAEAVRADGFGRYVAALAAELADLGREPAGIDGRDRRRPARPRGAVLVGRAAGRRRPRAVRCRRARACADGAGRRLPPGRGASGRRSLRHHGSGGVAPRPGRACAPARLRDPVPPGGAAAGRPGPDRDRLGCPRRLAETGYGLRRRELERALAGDLDARPAAACGTCAPRTPASRRPSRRSSAATPGRSGRSSPPATPACATTTRSRRPSSTCWWRSRWRRVRGPRG